MEKKLIDSAQTAGATAILGESAAAAVPASQAPAPNSDQLPLSPEMIKTITALRGKIQLSVGQVVLAIMNLPRYRHQSLGDLMHVVLDPLMRDRVAIAHVRNDSHPEGDEQTVAGIAIWATVSGAVDAKIAEQIKAGVFPVRLGHEDWTSGEVVWLLDVIAADRSQATRVLANFRQLSGERPVKIHPIVARSVDPALLEKMRVRPVDAAAAMPIAEPGGNA